MATLLKKWQQMKDDQKWNACARIIGLPLSTLREQVRFSAVTGFICCVCIQGGWQGRSQVCSRHISRLEVLPPLSRARHGRPAAALRKLPLCGVLFTVRCCCLGCVHVLDRWIVCSECQKADWAAHKAMCKDVASQFSAAEMKQLREAQALCIHPSVCVLVVVYLSS